MTCADEAKFPWVLNNGGLCVVRDKDFLSQEMDQIVRGYRQYTLHSNSYGLNTFTLSRFGNFAAKKPCIREEIRATIVYIVRDA